MKFFVGAVQSVNGLQLLVKSKEHNNLIVKILRGHISTAKYETIKKNLKKYRVVYTLKGSKAVTVNQKIQKKIMYEWRLIYNYKKTLQQHGIILEQSEIPEIEEIRMFYNFLNNGHRSKFKAHFAKYIQVYDALAKSPKTAIKNIQYVSYHHNFIPNIVSAIKKFPGIKMRYMKNYRYEISGPNAKNLDRFVATLEGMNKPNKIRIQN